MIKDQFMADIDNILRNVTSGKSNSLADKKVLAFDESMVERGLIKKVAFDVYRVENDPYDGLWIVENVDGHPHLVRASNPTFDSKVAGDWNAVSDYENDNVTLSYKSIPIARFSNSEYGFEKNNVSVFKTALLDVVQEDENFIKELLADQPLGKRNALLVTFPEFKKFL